jgi:hypothetical protein
VDQAHDHRHPLVAGFLIDPGTRSNMEMPRLAGHFLFQ